MAKMTERIRDGCMFWAHRTRAALLVACLLNVFAENIYSVFAYTAEEIAFEQSIIAKEFADCLVRGSVVEQTIKPNTTEPTILHCQDKCQADPACFYFSYDSATKQCRHHAKNINNFKSTRNGNGTVGKKVCGSMCTREGTLESAPVVMAIVDGTILSFEDCHKKCVETQVCSSAAFDYHQDTCYLFGGNVGSERFIPKRGVVWGEKRCISRDSDVFMDATLVAAGKTPTTQESWLKCRQSCQKAPKTCRLWSYNTTTKECFTLEHAALAHYKARAGSLSGPAWPLKTQQCLQNDTKFEGTAPVISTSKVLTVKHCQEKCAAEAKCFFFAFSTETRDCQLLDENGMTTVKTAENFISGPKTCSASDWCVEFNVAYHYSDLTPVTNRPSLNAQECKELCIRDPRCQLWSHARPLSHYNNHCYLKTYAALGNRQVTNAHDSGHGTCGTPNYCAAADTYYGASQHLRDVPITEAKDAMACQSACHADFRCYYYAFKAGTLCRLYPNGVTPKTATGFIGGPHQC